MNDFITNIKRDLDETNSEHVTVTLSRKDVEKLLKSYEYKCKLLNELKKDD